MIIYIVCPGSDALIKFVRVEHLLSFEIKRIYEKYCDKIATSIDFWLISFKFLKQIKHTKFFWILPKFASAKTR